jgi:hypothetical protein
VIVLLLMVLAIASLSFILYPRAIITVDGEGRIIGEIEYIDKKHSDSTSILGSSKRFVEAFLSHNSATVMEDKFLALSMMDAPLRDKWRKIWFDENAIARIKDAQSYCLVVIDDEGSSFKPTTNNTFFVSTLGQVKCTSLSGTQSVTEKFVFEFSAVPVQRTWKNTSGIKIVSLFNNPFDDEYFDEKVNS